MPVQVSLLIALAVVAALGLACLQYFKKEKAKRVPCWGLLCFLRFLTLFCFFLLLINPKFSQKIFFTEKPKLAVVVDNSASIEALEKSTSVNDYVEKLTTNKALNDRFTIETYAFGNEFEVADSFSFSAKQTNIYKALKNLKQLYKNQTAPTVLLTDGNQTYGQDYTFSATQYTQDMFPVVVGDTTVYPDLKINRLNTNKYAFLNNKFPVEVFLNYTGNKPVAQQFSIKQNGKTVFSEKVNFSKQKPSATIHTTLPANSVGVKTYTAHIESISNEKNTTNNTKKFAVEIIDEKTNILVLSSFTHPDLGALKKSIGSNQQRSLSLKKTSDSGIDFGNYQLIVLYQPDSSFEEAYQKIERLGLNTLTITGTKTAYNFLNNVQVYLKKGTVNQEENFLAQYNTNYSSFQFEDIGFDGFPPLNDKFGDLNFSKTPQVLLHQLVEGYQTENPLLATVEDNGKRHGFLFGENSWKWRAQSYLDNESFEKYDDFFGKLIQYLAASKKKERLTVDFESFYNSGEKIVLQAQYFDKNYEFDSRGKVYLKLKNETDGSVQSFPLLLKNNRYEVNLSNTPAGEYSFSLTVDGDSVQKNGNFSIIDFEVEKQFTGANLGQLQKIATENVYYLDDESPLIEKLLQEESFKPVQKSRTTKTSIIDWYYLLIVIVISLGTEWFLRKYYGLI